MWFFWKSLTFICNVFVTLHSLHFSIKMHDIWECVWLGSFLWLLSVYW
jgi:hypothetical protein